MFTSVFVVERNAKNMAVVYDWYDNIEPFYTDGISIRIKPSSIMIKFEYWSSVPQMVIINNCHAEIREPSSSYSEIPAGSCVWITAPADEDASIEMDFSKLATELIGYGGWYA